MPYVTRRPKPTRSHAQDDLMVAWFNTGPADITVHEPEDEAEYTGLVDLHGNGIYRTKDRIPMGYRVR